MKKILILGGGLIGSAIASDLAKDNAYNLTLADRDPHVRDLLDSALGIHTINLDVTDDAALTAACLNADLVIGAVPGRMGYHMLEVVIKADRDIVDISFCPENPLQLDDLAREHGVTVIVDAGVSPGMGNLFLGRYHAEYDSVSDFVCYVGGLPLMRVWPFEYQSVFSPIDVIEEYTRPARMMINGEIVTKPALTDNELINLPKVGTVEAFNTDGLRTLLDTMPIPNMLEKTLRFPGHTEQMRMMREIGLFSEEPMDIGSGQMVKPLDVTSRLLFKQWQPKGEGRDLVVLRLEITGLLNGKRTKTTVDLYDEYNDEDGTTAMARTTGYTCTASARMFLAGHYTDKGVKPLEFVGANEAAFNAVVADLEARQIQAEITRETLE